MPTLTSIHIYPLKSCAALALNEAALETRGFSGDRRWMLIDQSGKFVTGRQQARLTLIRAHVNGCGLRVEAPGMPILLVAAPVSGERVATAVWDVGISPLLAIDEAQRWFSTYLGAPHRLVYMDDACTRALKAMYAGRYGTDEDRVSLADAFPLLLITQAALDRLNGKLAQPVPMLRFRPNLVVAGAAPHAEDGWKRVRIGAVELEAAKPCVRCVFTTVDFERGERDPNGEPLRTLMTYRRTSDGVTFGQYLIPRKLGTVRVGDDVEVLA
jgi:uncharacterized protein YcbX